MRFDCQWDIKVFFYQQDQFHMKNYTYLNDKIVATNATGKKVFYMQVHLLSL